MPTCITRATLNFLPTTKTRWKLRLLFMPRTAMSRRWLSLRRPGHNSSRRILRWGCMHRQRTPLPISICGEANRLNDGQREKYKAFSQKNGIGNSSRIRARTSSRPSLISFASFDQWLREPNQKNYTTVVLHRGCTAGQARCSSFFPRQSYPRQQGA